MADQRNTAELNSGALHRYLAELVWMPTALLPGQGATWTPIDNSTALATITDAGITVSLEFHFNETGEVASIYTPARYAVVDGRYEQMPWEGRMRRYEERDGLRIPIEAEVEWRFPTGRFPVWKGTVTDITYEFARSTPASSARLKLTAPAGASETGVMESEKRSSGRMRAFEET